MVYIQSQLLYLLVKNWASLHKERKVGHLSYITKSSLHL